ncbi:MAG: hypothetical protein IT181_24010 [Acidobacteria bacterium]|nr:hypothetical protein [Acidobacteriota bacterium]
MDPSVLRPILEATWDQAGRPALGAASTREGRNQFFLSFCAVMHHGHPDLNSRGGDPRWVAKSAGNGRPQSDDSIAFADGGRLRSWDLIIGAGADGFRFIDASGPGDDITGQEPIAPPRSALPPARASGGSEPAPAPSASALQAAAEPWLALVDARFQHLRLGSDDQQREWMARVAFVLGQKVDAHIGQKRADASRPVSRNTLGIGATGALEAVVVINEQSKARVWQPLGTIAQVWVAPPVFTDMAEILAATPTVPEAPGSGGATPPAVDVEALRVQLAAIQAAAARIAQLLG